MILAEAGAGKTQELRHQAETLNAEGKYGFIVAIEDLADDGLKDSLDGPDDGQRFGEWQAGSDTGNFFLDSDDEARLVDKTLERALRKLSNELGSALERSHAVITCRVRGIVNKRLTYDGHTLKTVIEEMESWTGILIERAYVDKGYRGHDYPNKLKVYKSGQKRGITPTIKKELRRRSAVEAVIGHLKTDGRLGRNFLTARRARKAGREARRQDKRDK